MPKRSPPGQWPTLRQQLNRLRVPSPVGPIDRPITLKPPPHMDAGRRGDTSRLLKFISSIRKTVLEDGKKVLIDLSDCAYIGPIACMLLAAEVQRCNAIRPGRIWGNEPLSEEGRSSLEILGFYEAIGIEPSQPDQWDGVVQIASGVGSCADNAEKLAGIAQLAMETWGDQAFADRVHGALNEAITNVIMHAYDPEIVAAAGPCELGKWWVSGFSLGQEAWFMALDHGVGIPISAPAKNRGVKAYLAEMTHVADADVIHSVVAEEGRSRTGLANHGKGIPAMLSLINDRCETGAVLIMSGSGGFLLEKRAGNASLPGRILGLKMHLDGKLSGTLILWKVGKPIVMSNPENRP